MSSPDFDCHPEQAFFAQRGIWASRAMRRVLCDATPSVWLASLPKLPYFNHPALAHRTTFWCTCIRIPAVAWSNAALPVFAVMVAL
jgi:hypothetical protein